MFTATSDVRSAPVLDQLWPSFFNPEPVGPPFSGQVPEIELDGTEALLKPAPELTQATLSRQPLAMRYADLRKVHAVTGVVYFSHLLISTPDRAWTVETPFYSSFAS